jgi:hypothetical protein
MLLVPPAAKLLQLLAAVELELVHIKCCCLGNLPAVGCTTRASLLG